jgi:hypothetical protein
MLKVKTPIKAIRAKCLDCSGESSHEAKLCPITACPIYPYRLGKNLNPIARVWTEEQKEAARGRCESFMKKIPRD